MHNYSLIRTRAVGILGISLVAIVASDFVSLTFPRVYPQSLAFAFFGSMCLVMSLALKAIKGKRSAVLGCVMLFFLQILILELPRVL